MTRSLSVLAALLVGAMLIGCFTQQAATTIKADGSGTHSITIGISKAFLEAMMSQVPEEQRQEMTSEAMAKNAQANIPDAAKKYSPKVEALKDDKYIGIKVSFTFKTVDDLVALGDIAKGAGEWMKKREEGSEEGSEGDSGSKNPFMISKDGDNIVFQFGEENEGGDQPEHNPEMMKAMLEQMKGLKLSWTIEAPFIVSVEGPANIVKKDGNKVNINFEVDEKTDLTKGFKVVVKAALKQPAAATNGGK